MGAINDFIIKTLKTHEVQPWAGGDCPVDESDTVVVEHRTAVNGSNTRGKYSFGTAKTYHWNHSGGSADIVAYIVLRREQAQED